MHTLQTCTQLIYRDTHVHTGTHSDTHRDMHKYDYAHTCHAPSRYSEICTWGSTQTHIQKHTCTHREDTYRDMHMKTHMWKQNINTHNGHMHVTGTQRHMHIYNTYVQSKCNSTVDNLFNMQEALSSISRTNTHTHTNICPETLCSHRTGRNTLFWRHCPALILQAHDPGFWKILCLLLSCFHLTVSATRHPMLSDCQLLGKLPQALRWPSLSHPCSIVLSTCDVSA